MGEFEKTIEINQILADTYSKRFLKFGATPKGSYWLNDCKQNLRFQILLNAVKEISGTRQITLGDIGCGSGALRNHLYGSNLNGKVNYYGYDISDRLIDYCYNKFPATEAKFYLGDSPHLMLDFCLMSGTYNLTTTQSVTKWETYLYSSLLKCWGKTKIAMIFNLQYAQKEYISPGNIYYCKVSSILSNCGDLFGPTICIFDDRLSRDATFVVRK